MFLPYERARAFVRELKLKNYMEWRAWCKSGERPDNIPSKPERTYCNSGWISMADWLGCEVRRRAKPGTLLPYERARAVVRELKLKNQKEWQAWCKSSERPDNIPSNPDQAYRNSGWISVAEWLGCEVRRRAKLGTLLPYDRARAVVRELKLKSQKEWQAWSKSGGRPADIPGNPWEFYRDSGWISMGDWLGYEVRRRAKQGRFLPYARARAFVHELKLKSQKEWQAWSKSGERPADIPSNPSEVYRNSGWISMAEWLGCEVRANVKRTFLPYDRANAFVRELKLNNGREWQAWSKSGERPADIPCNPSEVYRVLGWISMTDWLGCEVRTNVKQGTFLPYERARAFVRELKLKNYMEWRAWCKSGERPDDIPSKPERTYRNSGWISTADWLGCEVRRRAKPGTLLPYERARTVVRELKLKNQKEWQAWCKSGERPDNIPSNPNQAYRNSGWISMADWLGYEMQGRAKLGTFLPYEQATAVVRELKLKSQKEWHAWSKSGERPANIPGNPRRVYRDSGWVSTADWLGCEVRRRAKPRASDFFDFDHTAPIDVDAVCLNDDGTRGMENDAVMADTCRASSASAASTAPPSSAACANDHGNRRTYLFEPQQKRRRKFKKKPR